jgi:hypothetical protein
VTPPLSATAIALTPLLLTTQMLVQGATAAFVSIDVLIDVLMAEANPVLLMKSPGDLFRRPLLLQLGFDQAPSGGTDARATGTLVLACRG